MQLIAQRFAIRQVIIGHGGRVGSIDMTLASAAAAKVVGSTLAAVGACEAKALGELILAVLGAEGSRNVDDTPGELQP